MPYTEITNTHPEHEDADVYALCNKEECHAAFARMFGMKARGILSGTEKVGNDTYSAERIFEDSNTYHANCFVCGVTVWCGMDCNQHEDPDQDRDRSCGCGGTGIHGIDHEEE